jgi:hypothetical protein
VPLTLCSIDLSEAEFLPEIDVTEDLLPRHRPVLRALAHVSARVDPDKWCLVGGLMVMVATREAGSRIQRAEQTKDADLLVDVCTHRGVMDKVVSELSQFGFAPDPAFASTDAARCTLSSSNSQIDVLCPDDATEDLLKSTGLTSIPIPGGRRALELAELVTITYDQDQQDVRLRVPLLAGAIVVKTAAALYPKLASQHRHIQDIAGMLAVLASTDRQYAITEDDRHLLDGLAPRLEDNADMAWYGMNDANIANARAGYQLLMRATAP